MSAPAETPATSTVEVRVRRRTLISSRPFAEVVERLTATIGRPDMRAFHAALVAAPTPAELQRVVEQAVGASGLMEFDRFDAGEVLGKGRTGRAPRLLRLLVGNPLVMSAMARRVPDAAAYAPVTILVDERARGVRVSFDPMADLLAPYGDAAAIAVARDLDAKVDALIQAAVR
jgi:hypothetical protein